MPLGLWTSPRARRLKLLVLAVSDRCDQACAHCDIWRGESSRGRNLTREERLQVVDEALAAGVEEALLTGGEPLLATDLWPVAERLRAGGVRLALATNGMLLDRYAPAVGALFHEVYVSLDGATPSTHDGLRGVPALQRLGTGLAALREAAPSVRRVARTTLHAGNLGELAAIVSTARGLGFEHVSFLALDASSAAFGGEPQRRAALLPGAEAVASFRHAVDALEAAGALADGFVLESASKLKRLARHLDASAGRASFERPPCDAPWWSSVVEADGALRPCFFHEPVGDARQGLRAGRGSPAYGAALSRIRRPNETCERCVCPKRLR
jgi:MoaA/NifB/PqqE/SkfB family radical SAM enzyme